MTVRIWKKLAAHYKDDQSIIGYDLLNEPIPHYLDTAYFNPKLEPVYRKIVSGIRKVDRNHVIFLGGAQWDSNFKVLGGRSTTSLPTHFTSTGSILPVVGAGVC